MMVLWLPYLNLPESLPKYEIGPGTWTHDTDTNWHDLVALPRPPWLEIFREFPLHSASSPGDPVRGSFVICEDREWLRTNAGRLVSVMYFICEAPMTRLPPEVGLPAELFRYYVFEPAAERDGQLVEMWTKKGPCIEDNTSLCLLPPLSLRTKVGRPVRPETKWAVSKALIARFAADPTNRVVTAVQHFFQAQFADDFTHPWDADYSAYCACLEGALDIDPFAGNLHKRLYDSLSALTGEDSDHFERWVHGLYGVRSVHAHGSEGAPPSGKSHLAQAYDTFRDRRGNVTVCRSLCRYALVEALMGRGKGNPLLDKATSRKLLHMCLYSGEYWSTMAKDLTANGSVDHICSLSGNDEKEFLERCHAFVRYLDWTYVTELPSGKKVRKCLRVCVRCVHALSQSPAEVPPLAGLEKLLEGEQDDQIGQWAATNVVGQDYYLESSVAAAMKSVVLKLAMFFARR
jgi:hypothetical protein